MKSIEESSSNGHPRQLGRDPLPNMGLDTHHVISANHKVFVCFYKIGNNIRWPINVRGSDGNPLSPHAYILSIEENSQLLEEVCCGVCWGDAQPVPEDDRWSVNLRSTTWYVKSRLNGNKTECFSYFWGLESGHSKFEKVTKPIAF